MTPPTTRLRSALEDGGTVFGLWAGLPSSLSAELAATLGYDFVCVDEQHGAVGPTELTSMLQAVQAGGAAPLVRVPQNEPWLVMRALDLGALGVIVPMVDGPGDAERAVAASRFPPRGTRSFGPVRAQLALGSSRPDDLDAGPLCLAMVETREGLEQVEAIAETPGLDGIYVGPSDLALALGIGPAPRPEHPTLIGAIRQVREVCAKQGLIAGMHCHSGTDAARFAAEGFQLLTVGVDVLFLRTAMARELAAARATATEEMSS